MIQPFAWADSGDSGGACNNPVTDRPRSQGPVARSTNKGPPTPSRRGPSRPPRIPPASGRVAPRRLSA